MVPPPVALIQEVAKKFDGRMQADNLFDPNVSRRSPVVQQSWELKAPPGEFFRHKVRIAVRGREVKLRANDAFVLVEVRGDLDVAVVSINRKDRIMCLRESSIVVPAFPSLPVFTSNQDDKLASFLSSEAVTHVLRTLGLGNSESLHIYRNGIHAYLQPESPEVLLSAVEAVCLFVDRVPECRACNTLFSVLPAELADLASVVHEWAISDDELRTEMLESAASEALLEFVATVECRVGEIEDYLGSRSAEREAVIGLNTLMECLAEARLMLSLRAPCLTGMVDADPEF